MRRECDRFGGRYGASPTLYMGCQWKRLPIDKGPNGLPEIHDTRVYRVCRRWIAEGCFDVISPTRCSLRCVPAEPAQP